MQALGVRALPTVRSPSDIRAGDMSGVPRRPASVGSGTIQPGISNSLKSVNRNTLSSQNVSSEDLTERGGTSKGRGRVLKVLGDIHLLAGILPSAVNLYIQSIEILRLTTDYLWHASALEGIPMALMILRFMKVDFPVRVLNVCLSKCMIDPADLALNSQPLRQPGRPCKVLTPSTRGTTVYRPSFRPNSQSLINRHSSRSPRTNTRAISTIRRIFFRLCSLGVLLRPHSSVGQASVGCLRDWWLGRYCFAKERQWRRYCSKPG
jgi:Transport protein Trs120 or TRAPPC9, TRAPP II complex subunit